MFFPAVFFFHFTHVSQVVEDLHYTQDSRRQAPLCYYFSFYLKIERINKF